MSLAIRTSTASPSAPAFPFEHTSADVLGDGVETGTLRNVQYPNIPVVRPVVVAHRVHRTVVPTSRSTKKVSAATAACSAGQPAS